MTMQDKPAFTGNFTEVETNTTRPPGFATAPPYAFKSTWEERPTSAVAIGLRLISVDEMQGARGVAADVANRAHPKVDINDPVNFPLWVECFNDALMLWIVSHAMCDPNDVGEPWKPFKAAPQDMAREYMTPDGVRLLYDHWEKMRVVSCPVMPEATADEITSVGDLIDEKLPHCDPIRGGRIRRLLGYLVEELHAIAIPTPQT